MSNNLDKDFDEIATKINIEIQKAKCSINRAIKLANKSGLDGFTASSIESHYLYDIGMNFDEADKKMAEAYSKLDKINSEEIRKLQQQLSLVGWRSSSLNC